MLDIKLLRNNFEEVEKALSPGSSVALIDRRREV